MSIKLCISLDTFLMYKKNLDDTHKSRNLPCRKKMYKKIFVYFMKNQVRVWLGDFVYYLMHIDITKSIGYRCLMMLVTSVNYDSWTK